MVTISTGRLNDNNVKIKDTLKDIQFDHKTLTKKCTAFGGGGITTV